MINKELTDREMSIIKCLVDDCLPVKNVASKLFISHHTVDQHMINIYRKLRINTKTELFKWYWTIYNRRQQCQ